MIESKLLKEAKVSDIQIAPIAPNHLVPYLSATCPHKTPNAAEAKDAMV